MQLEGVQSASAGKPHDEVTHIGVMRRKLTASLSKLRHGNSGSGRPRVVKPTANNLAAAAAAARADGGSGDGLGEESVHAGEEQADSSSHGPDESHHFARVCWKTCHLSSCDLTHGGHHFSRVLPPVFMGPDSWWLPETQDLYT